MILRDQISEGRARPVVAIDPFHPSITPAVPFDEDFVTISVLSEWLQAARIETRDETIRLRDVHCKGMRKIRSSLGFIARCNICYDENKDGYRCRNCNECVCISCFPQGMADRVREGDRCILYSCPTCRQCFAEFPEVSPDTSLTT